MRLIWVPITGPEAWLTVTVTGALLGIQMPGPASAIPYQDAPGLGLGLGLGICPFNKLPERLQSNTFRKLYCAEFGTPGTLLVLGGGR